jgi:hypothetical protein
MARTTAEEVEAIIKVKPTIDLTPFIDFANELVNDHCLDSDYADAKLLKIETLLAAHFYTVRDPRRRGEQVDTIRADYESKVHYGLQQSKYGESAMLLDKDGNLAAFNNSLFNQKPVSGAGSTGPRVLWLGLPPDRY